ncbi:MAG: hypothetical protein U1E73_12405 [Planctomycetota bacterium]
MQKQQAATQTLAAVETTGVLSGEALGAAEPGKGTLVDLVA